MNEASMQEQFDALNRKLDVILEEIALQRRRRRELDDLKEDLTRVGKDLYETALVELEDVHDYLQTGDVMHLGKKLLRNISTLTRMFEQIESLRDFLQDAAPLARESFIDFLHTMDEIDRKGYFAFAKELQRVADTIVTSFSTEDVKALGNNVVTILNTVKTMTQPDMLHAVSNAMSVYKKLDLEVTEDVSLLALLKEMNTPEAKRGLAFAIRFLKSISTKTTPQTGQA
jgi:uncharacterized protein YjgD (DUF1641 family)